MRKVLEKQTAWRLCVDILLAGLGTALVGFAEWNSLEFSTWWPIYLVGSFLFLGGLFLIWNGPLCAPVKEEPMPEADGVYLGKFNLNGYTFKAYERETVDGSRQFRLSAFPSITCEQEASRAGAKQENRRGDELGLLPIAIPRKSTASMISINSAYWHHDSGKINFYHRIN